MFLCPWLPPDQKRGKGMNLPISRKTRAAKVLLSGPAQSKLIALLPFSHLLSLPPRITHLPHPAKEEHIHPTQSKLIALLPFNHLLSPSSLLLRPSYPAKDMRPDPTPIQLLALLQVPSNHLSILPPLITHPPHPAKEMRLDQAPSQLIALHLSDHLLSLPPLHHLWTDRALPCRRHHLPQRRRWRRWHPIG